jgi:hypothetical protein
MTISPLALKAKKVIEAAWLRGPSYDLASQAAFALESAQLLQSPETAAELARLRKYAENRQSREEELLATMGQYDLLTAPDAWALGMTVISHLEGPHRPSAAEELEPGLRRLIEQLQTRVAELEQQLAGKDRQADEDPITYVLPEAAGGLTAQELALTPDGTYRCKCGHWDNVHGPFCFAAVCDCGKFAHATADGGVSPRVRELRELLAGQRDALEDPHDSPLHHEYRAGRDLPETGGAR